MTMIRGNGWLMWLMWLISPMTELKVVAVYQNPEHPSSPLPWDEINKNKDNWWIMAGNLAPCCTNDCCTYIMPIYLCTYRYWSLIIKKWNDSTKLIHPFLFFLYQPALHNLLVKVSNPALISIASIPLHHLSPQSKPFSTLTPHLRKILESPGGLLAYIKH